MSGDRPNRIGQVIGDRFRIDELIGRGAHAEVFRALDLTTSVFVALKKPEPPLTVNLPSVVVEGSSLPSGCASSTWLRVTSVVPLRFERKCAMASVPSPSTPAGVVRSVVQK